MEKYCTAGQATGDNIAQAISMLDTLGYKHTHSEDVIVIASLRQQLLHEGASVLSYTHFACLVYSYQCATSPACFFSLELSTLKIRKT
jgi:hypothetical protein